jgi:hypothetical protein
MEKYIDLGDQLGSFRFNSEDNILRLSDGNELVVYTDGEIDKLRDFLNQLKTNEKVSTTTNN